MKNAITGILLGFLAGCSTNPDGSTVVGIPGSPFWRQTASPEVVAAYYSERCETYGFETGTVAMAQCIRGEIRDDSESQREVDAKLQADIAKAFDRPVYTPPVRCRTYRYTSISSTTTCQ